MGLGFCSEIPWKSIIDITWIWVFVAYVLGLPWSSQISYPKGGNPQKLRPRVATRAFQVVWDHLSGKGSKAWNLVNSSVRGMWPLSTYGAPQIVMGCAHTAHVGYPKWDWGAPEKFSSKEWETGDLTIMQDWYWDTRTWGLNLKWKVVTCNVSHQFPMNGFSILIICTVNPF